MLKNKKRKKYKTHMKEPTRTWILMNSCEIFVTYFL